MNGKMLIKVTLNESTEPDLFAYLAQFDNARLRAGAFRALASAAARGDRSRGAEVHARHVDRAWMSVADPTARPHAESGHKIRVDEIKRQDFHAPAPCEPPVIAEPSSEAGRSGAVRRFDTDAIGEQFAEF
jgi:hypothetical protein